MSIPYSFLSDLPSGGDPRVRAIWIAAPFVGIPSLVIGVIRYRFAGRMGHARERRWAGVLIGAAWTGAWVWAFPSCIAVTEGI